MEKEELLKEIEEIIKHDKLASNELIEDLLFLCETKSVDELKKTKEVLIKIVR